VLYGLIVLLIILQYPLWFGDSSVFNIWQLKREIQLQRDENKRLADRNQALAAEVADLKQGLAAIEERSRSELGMIKKDETFFHLIQPSDNEDRPSRSKPK